MDSSGTDRNIIQAEIQVEVVEGDALTYPAGVLVLKYAQGLFGLDAAVVWTLKSAGRSVPLPDLGEISFEDGVAGIAAQRLLFVGVPGPYELVYGDIRRFACRALISIGEKFPQTKHVMLTIHGAGFGLDEVEAFRAEIAGLAEAIRAGQYPVELERVTIIENNRGRVKRLQSTLLELLDHGTIKTGAVGPLEDEPMSDELLSAGYSSEAKPKVFVAMPFKEEMDDTYHYGIQSAVNAAGYLCERADLSAFTGDVLEFVKSRIRSASLVVADLTEANPNVYLEVGYAWGVGIPTVLIVRKTEEVKFNVRGQRRLAYGRIKELEDMLTIELRSLPKRD
jgi:hypothetical protein